MTNKEGPVSPYLHEAPLAPQSSPQSFPGTITAEPLCVIMPPLWEGAQKHAPEAPAEHLQNFVCGVPVLVILVYWSIVFVCVVI